MLDDVPTASVHARSTMDHAQIAAARARHRVHRATVNRVTRSGWFVSLFGVALALIGCAALVLDLESDGAFLVGPTETVHDFHDLRTGDFPPNPEAACLGQPNCF